MTLDQILSRISEISIDVNNAKNRLLDLMGDLESLKVMVEQFAANQKVVTREEFQNARFLVINSYDQDCKINIIKIIRELTGYGLKEAKQLSESPFPIVVQIGEFTTSEYRKNAATSLDLLGGRATYFWR